MLVVDALEQAARRDIEGVGDPHDGRQSRLAARVLQMADLGSMQSRPIAQRLHRETRLSPDAPQLLAEAHDVPLALNRVHASPPNRP
jgi:hypothetical protein